MKHLIGISSIAAAIAFVAILTLVNKGVEERDEPKRLMQIHVVNVQPDKVTDKFIGNGQVTPRWQTTLSSEVSGQVLSVSEQFLSGATFNKGDVLVTIDDTAYVAALKTAKANLATAKRTLAEEKQRSNIASDNWKSSGFKGSPSDLVLRKPQLAEAQATLEAARATIKKAEYDLAQTTVTAPYDGIVISRTTNPGDVLQTGISIGTVYDRSLYEILVPLSTSDIARLPTSTNPQHVTVRSDRSDKTWKGTISRIGQILDPQNRWQDVIIDITDTQGLLPGEFASIEFTGHSYDHVLSIPENIPADDGYVWYVDAQDTLQRFMPDILFRKDGIIFVRAPFEKQREMRVTIGQDIFLPDIKVEPTMGEQ